MSNNKSVLRGAQSTPHIRTQIEVVDEKENSNECLSARQVERRDPAMVQFNAGCSSSSSDLSQLMEIYNDFGDGTNFEEWMVQYKKQRLQANGSFNSDSIGHEDYLSDSYGNLTTPQGSTHSVCDKASTYANSNKIHRSMDVLPTTMQTGFYTLEKCVSVVEFPPKLLIPPSKLCRSKEMPNILGVLDEDKYEQ